MRRRRRRGCARAPSSRTSARCALRGRGGPRGPRAEARAVRSPGGRLRRRRRAGDEHLFALGDRDRGAAAQPERICGMHFFNPPALMKLVEVVAGESTAEPALAATTEVAERMGRVPVRCADAPGFIVNRCNRPFALESLRMIGRGCRLAGADRPDRARGRRLPDGAVRAHGPDRDRRQPQRRPLVLRAAARAALGAAPDPGADGRRGPAGPQDRRRVLRVRGRQAGRRAEAEVDDELRRIVLDRLLAQLVNEGCFAADEGVAAPGDIDAAMRLGLNHPRGPFEWLERARAGAGVSDPRRARGRARPPIGTAPQPSWSAPRGAAARRARVAGCGPRRPGRSRSGSAPARPSSRR